MLPKGERERARERDGDSCRVHGKTLLSPPSRTENGKETVVFFAKVFKMNTPHTQQPAFDPTNVKFYPHRVNSDPSRVKSYPRLVTSYPALVNLHPHPTRILPTYQAVAAPSRCDAPHRLHTTPTRAPAQLDVYRNVAIFVIFRFPMYPHDL